MKTAPEKKSASRWPLAGKTAADLMTSNPVSLHASATIPEILAFLTDTGFSAAPVIDNTGRPIGVVSRTDVVVYDRAKVAAAPEAASCCSEPELAASVCEAPAGVSLPAAEPLVRASDLMTPAVFSVAPETPSFQVIEQMVQLNVHRLFVVDHAGVLIGVISVLDLLGHLCGEVH